MTTSTASLCGGESQAGASTTLRKSLEFPHYSMRLPCPGPLVNDFDPDGDAIQFVLVNGPTWGTLTIAADGRLTYQPGSQYAALDTIRYRVTDGRLYSQTVKIQIVTLAVPAPDIFVPPAPSQNSGPATTINPQNISTINAAEATTIAGEEQDTSANTSIQPGVVGSLTEPLIVQMGYTAKPILDGRDETSDRMLQSIGWVFEQGYRNVSDSSRSLSEQLKLRRDEIVVSMMANDPQWLITNLIDLQLGTAVITTANATLSAATAGTILWALRGAALVATIASGFPALRNLDPATLLAEYRSKKPTDESDDELEALIELPQSKS